MTTEIKGSPEPQLDLLALETLADNDSSTSPAEPLQATHGPKSRKQQKSIGQLKLRLSHGDVVELKGAEFQWWMKKTGQTLRESWSGSSLNFADADVVDYVVVTSY